MAFSIEELKRPASGSMWRAPARIYLDAARQRVVPGDSPEAAFLLVGKGCEIPKGEAERYGLVGKPGLAEPEPPVEEPVAADVTDEDEEKAAKLPVNKGRKAAEDK